MSKARYVPDKQKNLAAAKRYYASPKGQAKSRAWREARRIADPDINKKYHHQRNYGEPYEAKARRLEAQGGRCANPGCRTSDPGAKGWNTDHDHITGEVRGELCGGCNRALGNLKDDEAKIAGLGQYLRQHREGIRHASQ